MLDTRHRELPRLRRMGGGGDGHAMPRPLRVPTAYGSADRFELQRCNSEEGYVSLRDIVGSPEYAAGAAAAGRMVIRDRGDGDAMPRPLRAPTAYGGADRFELQRCNSEEGYVSLRDIVGSPEYAAAAAASAAASAGRMAIRDPLVKHAACAYLRLVPPHPPRRCCGRSRSLVRRFFAGLALLFRGCAVDPRRCFGCSRGHPMNL